MERRSDPTVVFKDPTSQVVVQELPPTIASKPKMNKAAAIERHVSRFQK